jgi:uncharacterized peroxidase-related enzyme
MARVALVKSEGTNDPVIQEIFGSVTAVEGGVPNHFYVEMNFPEFFKAKLGATRVLWRLGELSMPEIQHVGIAVSKANGCAYCTGAFCTILNYGLQTDESYVRDFVSGGVDVVQDQRLKTILTFALKVNADPRAVTDADIAALRGIGLTDKGVVQLVHVVSDFAAYNRLNLALQTDYDYQDMWRQLAFGWERRPGESEGDNTRGVRR